MYSYVFIINSSRYLLLNKQKKIITMYKKNSKWSQKFILKKPKVPFWFIKKKNQKNYKIKHDLIERSNRNEKVKKEITYYDIYNALIYQTKNSISNYHTKWSRK